MNSLWTSAELTQTLQQPVPEGITARGVSIDSRRLVRGDIFIAIKGENFDGARFIDDALAKGAALVITESQNQKAKKNVKQDYRIISVPSCQKALEGLAQAARLRTRAQLIAITGSVGKTSLKDGLAEILSCHRAEKSFNNHWGVPLTLARLPRDERFAVIEMGMNHAGEIAQLSRLARPNLAVITQIAPAHIGFFDSLEAIAAAKAEIFEGLTEGGTVLLNRNCPFFDFLHDKAKTKTDTIYSFGKEGHGKMLSITLNTNGEPKGATIESEIFGEKVSFFQYIPSAALAWNGIALLTIAHILGEDIARAAKTLSALRPRIGRGVRQTIKDIEVIDESYNANPASMSVALESLKNLSNNKRAVAVLGDMAELGSFSQNYHKALLQPLSACADKVFLCGEEMKPLYDILPADKKMGYQTNSAGLAQKLAQHLQKGDIVLVKASQKMDFAKVVTQLKEQL